MPAASNAVPWSCVQLETWAKTSENSDFPPKAIYSSLLDEQTLNPVFFSNIA